MQAQQGWQEVSTNIPAFYKSYQDLSFLASVLGVGFTKVSTLEDYDTAIKSDCISFYADGPIAIPNSPFGDSQVWQGCITIMYNNQRGMQIAMNGQTGDIKKRYGLPQSSAGGTTWSTWTDL